MSEVHVVGPGTGTVSGPGAGTVSGSGGTGTVSGNGGTGTVSGNGGVALLALMALMLTNLIRHCFQVIFVCRFQVIFVRFLVGFIQSGVVYCLVVEWLS